MEYFTKEFSQKRIVSNGTASSASSHATFSSASSIDSATTPPISPLLEPEIFDWADDVEEEIERQAQEKLALSVIKNIAILPQLEPDLFNWAEDVEETLEREQSQIGEQIAKKHPDEEHIREIQGGDVQIVRALGADLRIIQPYYRLPACAWNLYYLTCSLVEYKEYAQQLARNQKFAAPLLVITDEAGFHHLPEEVVNILTEEEIYEVVQYRDPYQEEFENYILSGELSSEEDSSQFDSSDDGEVKPEAERKTETGADGVDEGRVDEVTDNTSEYIEVQDLSYEQARLPNSYLISYGNYEYGSSPNPDGNDVNDERGNEEVEDLAATVRPVASPQQEPNDQAQFIEQLEEVKEILGQVMVYTDRLKLENSELKVECLTANSAKQQAEANLERLKQQVTNQLSRELADARDANYELQLYVISLTAELKRSRAACQTATIEKERMKADLQVLRDQMASHSGSMEDLSVQIEEETLHLQDEIYELRACYTTLEQRHIATAEEAESLRIRVKAYESVKPEGQHEIDESYTHQVCSDALASEYDMKHVDNTAEEGLFSNKRDAGRVKNSVPGTKDDTKDVLDDHNDTILQIAEDHISSSFNTNSDNYTPTISSAADTNLAATSNSTDEVALENIPCQTRAFTKGPPHPLTGPSVLGLSAYTGFFHNAYRNSASSILMSMRKAELENVPKGENTTKLSESLEQKQRDGVALPVGASFAAEYYEFGLFEVDCDSVYKISILDAGQDDNDGFVGSMNSTENLALSATDPAKLDMSTVLGFSVAPVGMDAVGDTVGDTVGGLNNTVEHRIAERLGLVQTAGSADGGDGGGSELNDDKCSDDGINGNTVSGQTAKDNAVNDLNYFTKHQGFGDGTETLVNKRFADNGVNGNTTHDKAILQITTNIPNPADPAAAVATTKAVTCDDTAVSAPTTSSQPKKPNAHKKWWSGFPQLVECLAKATSTMVDPAELANTHDASRDGKGQVDAGLAGSGPVERSDNARHVHRGSHGLRCWMER